MNEQEWIDRQKKLDAECDDIIAHPENYEHYHSFDELLASMNSNRKGKTMPESTTKQRLDETIGEIEEEIEELKAELRQWDSWRERYKESGDLDWWCCQVAEVGRDMNELMDTLDELRGVRESFE